ncbi:MAG TPA: sugar phosphate isomerase/epimerase [Oscillospiraceae bacterium]|nr:sugar phosphate isomerase/epimerase [Oscillospiraceae bacterium]HPF55095.1 sugar phosphate isomerase/epimerase [Clostridiales bacterium]HPK34417.1 sugar phosphate isomerase/epimerase [Oscillospiraceae bacterium]HPR75598.1 sugar phosphate isomerase/epimerase [Oscillospiraceae bacterium]
MITGFGAQLYTVRDFTKTPADIEKTFERVAAIGYKSVQISAIGEIEAKHLAEIAQKTGLVIALSHTPPQKLRENLAQVMADHETFGCNIVGLGAMPQEYKTGADGVKQFISDFAPIGKELAKNGFTFAYHNHAFDFVKSGESTLMDIMLQNSDAAWFKLTADIYWLQAAGINPASFIRQNGSRIAALHLKDMAAAFENKSEMAELGNGNLDFADIIGAAKQAGIPWYMVEQDICKGDPFDALTVSYDYIKKSGLLN